MEENRTGKAVIAREDGDLTSLNGDEKIQVQYEVPFTSHATMEPMNCVAHVKKNSCEIWAPTQSPQRVQTTAANTL